MKRVKIYRVENLKGHGMYCGGSEAGMQMFETRAHPDPRGDSLLCYKLEDWCGTDSILSNHYFGFGSMQQLLRWVYKKSWQEDLHESGYKVSVFYATGMVGNTQAVFDKNTREETIETVSLLNVQGYQG